MSNTAIVPHDCADTLTALVSHTMTPIEIEALAEELMQDAQFTEADAYHEAVTLFPSLYLHADAWDFYVLCHGNDDAAAL
jgi:hypothetical protein